MNCPACKEPMVVLELDEVEVDHCLSCKGIWLDGGELELLLGDAEEKDRLLSSFQAARNTKEEMRKCPICFKKMQKVICGAPACCEAGRNKDKQILIDECPQKDGLWFDMGELEEVIRMGTLDEKHKVLDLLKDMFKKP